MISVHDIDADMERLTSVVTGIVTLVAIGYNTWQNVRARRQVDQTHAETLKAITKTTEETPK